MPISKVADVSEKLGVLLLNNRECEGKPYSPKTSVAISQWTQRHIPRDLPTNILHSDTRQPCTSVQLQRILTKQ
jgi:hypothetical protein